MIEEILPRCVAAAEAMNDPPGVVLFPEEAAVLAGAADERRREYATARACARAALRKLGLPPVPILPGPTGAPQWPAGVAGSITHCSGYRACAVGWKRDVMAIGIDAEPQEPLPEGVLGAVATSADYAHLRRLEAAKPSVPWDRLLFSAKEAVYKAWCALTGHRLNFADASVEIDPVGGTFAARLLIAGPVASGRRISGFPGRWLVRDGLVITAVVAAAGALDVTHDERSTW
jgi:4'-phosphopantetheinyl transferase EntD